MRHQVNFQQIWLTCVIKPLISAWISLLITELFTRPKAMSKCGAAQVKIVRKRKARINLKNSERKLLESRENSFLSQLMFYSNAKPNFQSAGWRARKKKSFRQLNFPKERNVEWETESERERAEHVLVRENTEWRAQREKDKTERQRTVE